MGQGAPAARSGRRPRAAHDASSRSRSPAAASSIRRSRCSAPTTTRSCAAAPRSRRSASTAAGRSCSPSISTASASPPKRSRCRRRPGPKRSSRWSSGRRHPTTCCGSTGRRRRSSRRPRRCLTGSTRCARGASALKTFEVGAPPLLLGGAKTTSYDVSFAARRAAEEAGADDALLVGDGRVLEGATANVWWRRGDVLYTPAVRPGVLPGVTRAFVLSLEPAHEGEFEVAELLAADEAFMTSSIREVMPVVAVDGAAIGDGRPGPAAGGCRRAPATLRGVSGTVRLGGMALAQRRARARPDGVGVRDSHGGRREGRRASEAAAGGVASRTRSCAGRRGSRRRSRCCRRSSARFPRPSCRCSARACSRRSPARPSRCMS